MENANKLTIKNAFARLMATKDEVVEAGMYDLLENAVHIALQAHNEQHQNHIEIGDTYGWMLVHNHRIKEIAVVSTANNKGRATKQLRAKLKELPQKGWVGVVMAGLDPASYFSLEYEEKMLTYSKRVTQINFSQYYKKI